MKTDGCRMHCIRSFSVLIYFLYIFGRQKLLSLTGMTFHCKMVV
jgi:hypothetical protein